MPQKVCPRCGSQYASLKSATCPQCFALLETVDDDLAAAMWAARSETEQSPEFQKVKEVEDEKFRHESFQACLGVAVISLLTLIACVIIVVTGVVRSRHNPNANKRPLPPISKTLDLLTALPRENAPIEDVMPAQAGPFHLLQRDQQSPLSGTLTQIYHARYQKNADTLDVYAISAERPVSELDSFRDAINFMTALDAQNARSGIQFRTEHWHYGAVTVPKPQSANTVQHPGQSGGTNPGATGVQSEGVGESSQVGIDTLKAFRTALGTEFASR